MSAPTVPLARSLALAVLLALGVCGCRSRSLTFADPTPTAAGLNTNNLVDPKSQAASKENIDRINLAEVTARLQKEARTHPEQPKRSVLCLSGGGNYGAYAAGVLCGWTCRGDRPDFDVVTGISTGSLIAPFAFLGSKYDPLVKQFYTTVKSKDLYRTQYVRGLFSESLADNTPLVEMVDEMFTMEVFREIAAAHAAGRRLYIGTTEVEGRRFVVWDIGEIASRGTCEDLVLAKKILLGSSAIPGFFPPQKIPVTVDGVQYIEKHVDGGTSQSLFFGPPTVLPGTPTGPGSRPLQGTDVYAIVAGKLYADPTVLKPRALRIMTNTVSTVIYAQTRGDLSRLWIFCTLTGMNFHMTAIPAEYPAPASSTDFIPAEMTGMFNEGVRQVMNGTVWRTLPPLTAPGEDHLYRNSTTLTYEPRSPDPVPRKK